MTAPVITISDDNFAWLQRLAVPLVDRSVDDVLERRIRPMVDLAMASRGGAGNPPLPSPKSADFPERRFGRALLEVLRDIGPAKRGLVLGEMKKRLAGKLKPDDFRKEKTGTLVWNHHVDGTKALYKRLGLVDDGPRGFWNVTDQGRDALK